MGISASVFRGLTVFCYTSYITYSYRMSIML
nr:MAG TPA: hypothetical protein [Crassvirales sp.]